MGEGVEKNENRGITEERASKQEIALEASLHIYGLDKSYYAGGG